ncbi:hypothetical protein CMU59_16845 [Elizabethkingia anophelis]|uniref:hypothetical protein n=2 Tax=Elizabethkingia anophelis TaxID=1117645 RepID=UPI0004E419FB|nr:hypothetical protein [Elizabethkingia anophelis]KFC39285.1 hypothetical protein FF18_13325 [Elizabethkingia anophelis]MCL1689781.1 hypothetical protein [Elizabethkingia anophelis]MCT3787028.1 hypothetical protein [Elizabethkingia anophelis]MDV3500783.1 hypothetical protein [Elizabethkingia anophelis]MDV3568832.1 hypothetical protein [Elizabethkingia anophelis]
MKKIIGLILLFYFYLGHSQAYYIFSVLDTESGLPISNAKIITSTNDVHYTNDDGKVFLPSDVKSLNVSAPTYEEQNINFSTSTVKLKPVYKDIDEVQITNIDIKQLLENTLTNYLKLYYSKPSLYYGEIKQKAYLGGQINNLLVADINIWSLANVYNFKEKDNIDSFAQLGLNNIKYYKTRKRTADYPFNNDAQIIPRDFVLKLFFNGELVGVLNELRNDRIKVKLAYENTDIKIFLFEANNETTKVVYKGKLVYSKKDMLITYFDINAEGYKNMLRNRNKNEENYDVVNTSSYMSYDFYKNSNRYIPASIKSKGKGYILYKGQNVPFEVVQYITLQKFQESGRKGLKNKIDLTKNLTDNIPDKEIKETETLLSEEEQRFINER